MNYVSIFLYVFNIFFNLCIDIYIYTSISPPHLGGVCLPTFCPEGTLASFWLKFNKKLANILLYAKYNILYQRYTNKMTFASF